MQRTTCLALGLALTALSGCTSDGGSSADDGGIDVPPGDDAGIDTPPGDDAAPPPDGGDESDATVPDDGTTDLPPAEDAGADETTPPPCSTTLADRLRVTTVDVSPYTVETYGGGYWSADRPVSLATQPDGSSRVAWTDGTGAVHVTPLDASDARRSTDWSGPGTELRGFVAMDDGAAVLVRRDDEMVAVRFGDSDGVRFTVVTVGGSSHDVENSRWIDDWSHDGRLAWSGTQLAIYHGQTGNWGSSGNHQGDRLEYLDASGARSGAGWDWGCSHSLDVRLAWNGTAFGPVCLSDCYPGKGIYFAHNYLVRDEPSGNCAGTSDASLGGLVPVADGFWLSFVTREGRASADVGLVHVANDGTPGTPFFLTDTAGRDESAAHLAAYGPNLLAAWQDRTEANFAVVSSAGTFVEGPVVLTASFAARDDFVNWPNGDAGWAVGAGSALQVYRLARCE
ncbi:MAG: hypothetical protein HY905_17960 [Deltaproteobacteria bacterium]|nr:hypothetical protein [Deltaproteobacteria bacterium]